MKLFQINTSVNTGSTGRIAEEIGIAAIEAGYKSYIAAAYSGLPSKSEVIKIGNSFDRYMHGLKTRLLDRHGFGSLIATKNLIYKIDEIKPDIIHLHNIHGYYIHVGVLFDYLKKNGKPVVWTLHDCWPFTGHCTYFDRVNCEKWESLCHKCPLRNGYPASWLLDNSRKNYITKRILFQGPKNMTIVTPSEWLSGLVKRSFLSGHNNITIQNGVDISKFKPAFNNEILRKYEIDKNFILGVSNLWSIRKGLKDIIRLRDLLPHSVQIVVVGSSRYQKKSLPPGITGIERTENLNELSALYSAALTLINPTYVDNFPSVNLESLACGTPVITYNTGGSPEAIDEQTGYVVERGDINGLKKAVIKILNEGKEKYSKNCRARAEKLYDKKIMCNSYLSLYNEILNK